MLPAARVGKLQIHLGPPGAVGLQLVQQSVTGLHGWPGARQVAAWAGVGTRIEVMTGKATAVPRPNDRAICRRDIPAIKGATVSCCSRRLISSSWTRVSKTRSSGTATANCVVSLRAISLGAHCPSQARHTSAAL